MIKEAIVKLAEKENLSGSMAEQAMDEIMSGPATPVQMSAFLVALSMKGATIEEITACAKGMRNHCVKLLNDQDVLEIVGTGGDRANSFNISTISALVVSAEKGPKRNAVVLNSAAALHITKGISMEDAVVQVQELIDSGKAREQMEAFITLSNQI